MPAAKGEAGDLAPRKVGITGVEARVETGAGNAHGQGQAFGAGAAIVAATGSTSGTNATFALSGDELSITVDHWPFSETGMAERFVADPEHYRGLASFVASELRRQANGINGLGNEGAATKGQLNELADSFEEVATRLTTTNGILTPEGAAMAAAAVTKLRAAYSALAKNCPELLRFAQVGLAALALCQFGLFDNNLVLEVSAAVIGGVGVASALKKKN